MSIVGTIDPIKLDQPVVKAASQEHVEHAATDVVSATDTALEQKIIRFFDSRHVPGLRHVGVHAQGGVVTITGKVLTYYEKQLCNQCSRIVPGITQLINAVEVCDQH